MRLSLSCLLTTLCLSAGSAIDGPIFPQLSPAASVSQTIGTTLVTLKYHRPAARGRAIYGALVPYGQVWRAGANEATTIAFSDAVKIDGRPIPAGTYALFSVPGPDRWTLILNKRAKQWGAWEYQPKDDLLRFEVKPKAVNPVEWLTYAIDPASPSSAYVDLYWEKLRISFLVEVDVEAMVSTRLKKALLDAKPGDWKIYADAAEYCLDQDWNLSQALGWADKSISIRETPVNLYVKARLLRQVGQNGEALKVIEKALHLAKAQGASAATLGPIQATLSQWRTNGTNKNE